MCISSLMFKHTLIRPEVAETPRRKRVLLSMLIVTIDPSKGTEEYIVDHEAVWSWIILLKNFVVVKK